MLIIIFFLSFVIEVLFCSHAHLPSNSPLMNSFSWLRDANSADTRSISLSDVSKITAIDYISSVCDSIRAHWTALRLQEDIYRHGLVNKHVQNLSAFSEIGDFLLFLEHLLLYLESIFVSAHIVIFHLMRLQIGTLFFEMSQMSFIFDRIWFFLQCAFDKKKHQGRKRYSKGLVRLEMNVYFSGFRSR